MITHVDSYDFDNLITVHRELRDLFPMGSLRWLLESEKIDTLQRVRKSLFGEYLTPTFYTAYNFDNNLGVCNVNETEDPDNPFLLTG